MANENNITLRSEKGSFLLFEEMDLNLLQLKELIVEFNGFVNTNFANHVADFNAHVAEFNQYKLDVQNEFLSTVKLDTVNTFSALNIFSAGVQISGASSADDLSISGGSINGTAIGDTVKAAGSFTNLSANNAVTFATANSFRLPIWTTATRPAPTSSSIGFNSDTGEFEGHNGTTWISVGGAGFGTAAYSDITTSATDTTAGRVLKVGDFGIGEVNAAPVAVDLNSLPASGSYQIIPTTLNRPFDYGTVFEQRRIAPEKTQIATSVTSERVFFRKFQSGLDVWSPWVELINSSKITVDAADATIGKVRQIGQTGWDHPGIGTDSVSDILTIVDDYPYSGLLPFVFGTTNPGLPHAGYFYMMQFRFQSGNCTIMLLPYAVDDAGVWVRSRYSGAWSSWKRLDGTTWADITGIPAYASRWPTWGEVTGKPSTSSRWPTWGEVTGKPSTFPPSAKVCAYSGSEYVMVWTIGESNRLPSGYVMTGLHLSTSGTVDRVFAHKLTV